MPFLEEEEDPEAFEAEARDSRDSLTDRTEDADEKERAELEDRVGEPLGTKTARRDERSVSRNAFATLQSLPEDERLSTGALDARGFAVDETRYLERFFRRLNKATPRRFGVEPRARAPERGKRFDLRDIVAGYLNAPRR